MLQLFKLKPINERKTRTKRKHWLSQGQWKIFVVGKTKISHVKGLVLYDLPPMSRVKYLWEDADSSYKLWFLCKGMSDKTKSIIAFPTEFCTQPRPIIWFYSKTTVERRVSIKAEFFDIITNKYPDVEFRVDRKTRWLLAFNNTYSGAIRNGLLAIIKPYDLTYDYFAPGNEFTVESERKTL